MSPEEKHAKEMMEFIKEQDYMHICPVCKDKSLYMGKKCYNCEYHKKKEGNMLILPCTIKNFNTKDEDVILNITVRNHNVSPEDIKNLFLFKNETLNLALAPLPNKEVFIKNLEQLDFTVKCPDCGSYDCKAGERIGVCSTCEKEFSLSRPDARQV